MLNRIDGARTVIVQANVAAGVQVAAVQQEVTEALAEMDLGSGIRWKLAGADEDRPRPAPSCAKAFGAAIFLIFVVLLAQFNKFTSVWLVLSCVVMSTIGVFLGLLITGQPFGIVMTGIGVIALAGVVVNNNIVLIDTYDRLRDEGWDKIEAMLQTCRERARPVVLTALSAILGVLPIAFGLGPGDLPPRDHDRRAVDAVVDLAVVGHRLRPGLRHGADAGGDAVDADGVHPRQAQEGRTQLVRQAVPPGQGQAARGAGAAPRRRS